MTCLLAATTAQAPSFHLAREIFIDGGACTSLRYAPDGRVLAAGGEFGDVLLLDAASGEVLRRFEGGREAVTGIALSPDGRRLAAASRDVRIWDLEDGHELATPLFHGKDHVWLYEARGTLRLDVDLHGNYEDIAFAPDGRLFLCSTRRGLKEIDPLSGQQTTHHVHPWSGFHVLRDGTVLGVGRDGLGLWDPASESTVARLDLPNPAPLGLSVSDDETRILVTCPDRLVMAELVR